MAIRSTRCRNVWVRTTYLGFSLPIIPSGESSQSVAISSNPKEGRGKVRSQSEKVSFQNGRPHFLNLTEVLKRIC